MSASSVPPEAAAADRYAHRLEDDWKRLVRRMQQADRKLAIATEIAAELPTDMRSVQLVGLLSSARELLQ